MTLSIRTQYRTLFLAVRAMSEPVGSPDCDSPPDTPQASHPQSVPEQPTPETLITPTQPGSPPTHEDLSITPSVYAGRKRSLQGQSAFKFLNDKNTKRSLEVSALQLRKPCRCLKNM